MLYAVVPQVYLAYSCQCGSRSSFTAFARKCSRVYRSGRFVKLAGKWADCALAVGLGLGREPGLQRLLLTILQACPIPMVLDADALNLLAVTGMPAERKAPTCTYPHPGEAARLLGTKAA